MSIIKSIKQVLGLSGTASENHFWDGSVANKLSLKRGTPDVPGATVMQVVDGKASVALGSILSAKLSGDQSVISGINTTPLLLNNFDVAVGGTLNGTTGEWTPSVAGWYEVSLTIELLSSTANQLLFLFPKVQKNGVVVVTGTGMFGMSFAVNPGQIVGVATGLIYMNGTTDVMRAMVTYASGSAAAIISSTTRFNCKLVSIG